MNKYLNEKTLSLVREILSLGILLFFGYIIFLNNAPGINSMNNGDVHRGYQRAISILNNVNPYLEFNPKVMLDQEKVPGFFPIYFFFMALIAKVSNYSFVLFLDNLRYIVFLAYTLTAVLIYMTLRKQSKLLALFSVTVYMFNRWTLNDVIYLKQDSYVLLLILFSLLNLEKNKKLSFLLYGIATGLKHLTILISPIYLVALITPFLSLKEDIKNKALKKKIIEFAIIFSFLIMPALLPSIPFLIQTPKNFIFSIIYQVTRVSEASGYSLSTGFDKLLVLYNQDRNNNTLFYMIPRLPMVISLIMLSILYVMKKLNVWKYAAFTYVVFVGFNPVLFNQYYIWLITFLPFVFLQDPIGAES